MDVAMRPAKRIKLDLRETFPVLAGRQLFTLHASVFIPRSRFLTAQRQQPEWIRNVLRPIDLSDQNPNHFEMYMQLVYSGTAVLYERISDFESAIEPFGTRLLFKNIPQIVDRAALREQLTALCTQFGEIKNLRVSNSNKSYVEFTSIDACTQASKEELWVDDLLLNTHISLKVALIKAGHTGDRLAQLVWDDLIRIYLLTDKLQDARAMNQVMQVMLDFFIRHKQVPNDQCVALAYKYTDKNDPLRILMRDTCVSRLDYNKDYLFGENEYPKAFIQDILEEVIPRIAKKQKFEIYDRDSHCKNYHEHNVFYHKAEDCEF